MSEAIDFVHGMWDDAAAVLGTVELSVGGGAGVECVPAARSVDRDYEAGGHEEAGRMSVVVKVPDWLVVYAAEVEDYLGATASVDGVEMTVVGASIGPVAVTLELGDEEAGG